MTVRPVTMDEAEVLLAPLARFPRVALAVSGGPDSLALMHLAAGWRGRRRDRPALFVLTVDHGLRPGSRDEALMVAHASEAEGLPHALLAWEHGPVDTGLQARARTARYDLMAAYCTRHDIPALVTAHHLDDQVETFLMRLKRGSGLDGLSAIPEEGVWAGLTLLRPLLDMPKTRLVATVEAAGMPFVIDESNLDPRFERGRMRGAADALATLGLTPEAIALSARRLRRARAALDAVVRDFLLHHGETSEAGYASIDQAVLFATPEEIALRVLARLLAIIGGGVEPVRLAKLETLLAALRIEPDKAHTLSRCRIVPRAGRLSVFREMRKEGLPVAKLRPGERTLWDNRFHVELDAEAAAPLIVKALGEEGVRMLKEREALPPFVPRFAARTLPACWRGETLLGLPRLEGAPLSRHEAGFHCRATFLREGL